MTIKLYLVTSYKIYIIIYIKQINEVCILEFKFSLTNSMHSHTHTHTHTAKNKNIISCYYFFAVIVTPIQKLD